MSSRHLSVRPDLDQLRHQAKDLLRAVRRREPAAVAEFTRHHPDTVDPADAKLADAQLALARSYGNQSWPRLVMACEIIDAIWRDDIDAVRTLVSRHPRLLHEMARGTDQCNWGPPMSYAANLGRDRIIGMLRDAGATDVQFAFDRACLQGADVNARAAVDADGFGGHTALFGCVVSQPYRCGLQKDAAFARLLLDHGADPNVRASLRKRLLGTSDESMHTYRDVTPLSWGQRFHDRTFVNQAAMRLIAERGGHS